MQGAKKYLWRHSYSTGNPRDACGLGLLPVSVVIKHQQPAAWFRSPYVWSGAATWLSKANLSLDKSRRDDLGTQSRAR